MSIGADLAARMAALEAQVQALTQQVQSDSLAPNYLTVDAQGHVSANFTGIITALGLTIPEGTTPDPAGDNAIAWQDPAGNDNVTLGATSSSDTDFLIAKVLPVVNDDAAIRLFAFSKGSTHNASVQLEGDATESFAGATADSHSVTLILNDGSSSFPQIAGGAKIAKIAWGAVQAPVGIGDNFVAVPFGAALPNVNNMFPFYSVEPLGAAHSITKTEIGAFTANSLTVGISSSAAQQVQVYAFAVGGS